MWEWIHLLSYVRWRGVQRKEIASMLSSTPQIDIEHHPDPDSHLITQRADSQSGNAREFVASSTPLEKTPVLISSFHLAATLKSLRTHSIQASCLEELRNNTDSIRTSTNPDRANQKSLGSVFLLC